MIEHSFSREQISEMYDIYRDYLNALSDEQATKFLGNSRLSHINASLTLLYEGTPAEIKEQVVEHLTNCFPSSKFQNMLKIHVDSIDKIDRKRFHAFLLNCQKDGVDIVTPLEKEIVEKSLQGRQGINFLMDALFHVTSKLPEHKKASHVFQMVHNYRIQYEKQDTRNRLRQAAHIVDYFDYPEAQKFLNSPHNPDFVKDYMKEKINAKAVTKAKSISSDIEDFYLINFNFKHNPFMEDADSDERVHQYMTTRLVQNLCSEYLPIDKAFNAEISAGNKNPELGSVISFTTKEKHIQSEVKQILQLFNENMQELANNDSDNYIDFCDHFDKLFIVCKLQRDLPEKQNSPSVKI